MPVGDLTPVPASFLVALSHLILSKPCGDTIITKEQMRKPDQGTQKLSDWPKTTQLPSGRVSIQIQKGKSVTDCKIFHMLFNPSEPQFVYPYNGGTGTTVSST